jgi:alpha-L-arabinofuranosidase
MASYAPLFSKLGHSQWKPDLIWFDNTGLLLTPNYYVQALFAQNRPEAIFPTTVSAPLDAPSAHGMIGVGTWKTQADYKDIRVVAADGHTLFQSDFSHGLEGWKTAGGQWQAVDGVLRQTGDGENIRAVAGDPSWTNYTLTLKARKISGEEGFLVLFQTPDLGSPTWWNLGGWGNTEHGLQGAVPENHVPGSIETGRWYDIKIEVRDDRVRAYLGGKLVQQAEQKPAPTLYSVAGRSHGDLVLDVVNISPQPQPTLVNLEGISTVASTAEDTFLTSPSADDENLLKQPPKVAPVNRTIQIPGPKFTAVFPANSISVIRLKID